MNGPIHDKGVRHGSAWTKDDIAFLRANYGRLTKKQIAAALGRGFPAVTERIRMLRLARIKEWTPEQDAFLRRHADKGWQWCAKELGRSDHAIRARVKRLGIQHKMLNAGDLQMIRDLHRCGMTTTKIGADLGVSGECIRAWLRKWGLPVNPRDERKRMATLQRTLHAKYGVENIAQVNKMRKRRLRTAALQIGLKDMAKRISKQR